MKFFLGFTVVCEVRVVGMDGGWLAQDKVAPFVWATGRGG